MPEGDYVFFAGQDKSKKITTTTYYPFFWLDPPTPFHITGRARYVYGNRRGRERDHYY
jgi:hypothetical protein